jgi:hypothetical protein
VAPEHVNEAVLDTMKKPKNDDFVAFGDEFKRASAAAGRKQYLVPYFIASHPASDVDAMIELAVFLKQNGYRPDQVQDFIPSPFDIAACMFHTGLDPFTKKPVYVAKQLRDRKVQRALLQFFKPENYFMVREALMQAGRRDLIGNGCDCLIPAQALLKRRREANRAVKGDHYHSLANPDKGEPPGERGLPNKGYRPGRKSANRRQGKKNGGGSAPSRN